MVALPQQHIWSSFKRGVALKGSGTLEIRSPLLLRSSPGTFLYGVRMPIFVLMAWLSICSRDDRWLGWGRLQCRQRWRPLRWQRTAMTNDESVDGTNAHTTTVPEWISRFFFCWEKFPEIFLVGSANCSREFFCGFFCGFFFRDMYRTKPPEKKSQKKSQKNSQRNSPVQFASSTAKYSRKKFTKLLWGSLLSDQLDRALAARPVLKFWAWHIATEQRITPMEAGFGPGSDPLRILNSQSPGDRKFSENYVFAWEWATFWISDPIWNFLKSVLKLSDE